MWEERGWHQPRIASYGSGSFIVLGRAPNADKYDAEMQKYLQQALRAQQQQQGKNNQNGSLSAPPDKLPKPPTKEEWWTEVSTSRGSRAVDARVLGREQQEGHRRRRSLGGLLPLRRHRLAASSPAARATSLRTDVPVVPGPQALQGGRIQVVERDPGLAKRDRSPGRGGDEVPPRALTPMFTLLLVLAGCTPSGISYVPPPSMRAARAAVVENAACPPAASRRAAPQGRGSDRGPGRRRRREGRGARDHGRGRHARVLPRNPAARAGTSMRQAAFATLNKLVIREIVQQEAKRIGLVAAGAPGSSPRRGSSALDDLKVQAVTSYGAGTTPERFVEVELKQSLSDFLRQKESEAAERWLLVPDHPVSTASRATGSSCSSSPSTTRRPRGKSPRSSIRGRTSPSSR